MTTDKDLIESCLIEYENGVERNTSIRYFVEKALEDPEATVYDSEGNNEVTDIEAVEKSEVAA